MSKINLLGIGLLFTVCLPVQAFYYTNQNFLNLDHETPVYFETTYSGGFWGYTDTGREFTQKPIINDLDLRIHRFTIDEVFFYITDRGPIFAESDLQAVSIYYTLS